MPAVARHIGRTAQLGPDLSGRDSRIQCLIGGSPSESVHDEIAYERPAQAVAELLGDSEPELTQSHAPTVAPTTKGPAGAGPFVW